MHNLHPGASGCKFAPGRKFTPGCKFAPPYVAFIFTPGCKFAPLMARSYAFIFTPGAYSYMRSYLHPGANLHPLFRVHMSINCVHTHLYVTLLFEYILPLRGLFMTSCRDMIITSLRLDHIAQSGVISPINTNPLFGAVESVRGSFLVISTAECVVENFTIHSYKGQVRKAYS